MTKKEKLPKYCFARGNRIWTRMKDADGKWKNKPTPFSIDQPELARRLVHGALRSIEVAKETGTSGEVTLRVYVTRWVKERRDRGVASVDDELAQLEKYVLPSLGATSILDLRPRHARDLVRSLRSIKGDAALAPRTIINIYSTLHNVMEGAVVDELITANPIKVRRGELPRKLDKDPEWRGLATYSRAEVEKLISDPIIPAERRVMYAVKALAGLRHGEAAALCLRHIDWKAAPLPRMTITQSFSSSEVEVKSTKDGQTRTVPIHPALGALLRAWIDKHWARVHGRAPGPDDFLLATRTGTCVTVKDACEAMKRDLAALGLRVDAGESRDRGGHDLRAWFSTKVIEDGGDSLLVRRFTHASDKSVAGGYERFSWAALCRELEKLQVTIPVGDPLPLVTSSLHAEAKARNRWRKVVTPLGLEHRLASARMTEDSHSSSGDASHQASTAVEDVTSRYSEPTSAMMRVLTEVEFAIRDLDLDRARELVRRIRGTQSPISPVSSVRKRRETD